MPEPQNLKGDQSSSDYILEDVTISSTRQTDAVGVQLKAMVIDFDIFEHIQKPYLTGRIAILDQKRLYDSFDFQGAEYITVGITPINNSDLEIRKRFVIHKIEKTGRTNESNQVIVFHIVEDIQFHSNIKNVNKSFIGKPSEIINLISNDYLGKKIKTDTKSEYQRPMKVVVPNLNPLESMQWIKNRATTNEGYPFYLFSAFAEDKLFLVDLATLLTKPPINERIPFVHTQASSQGKESAVPLSRFTIFNSYHHGDTENMYEQIKNGIIGARYSFYDTHTGTSKHKSFNLYDDLIKTDIRGSQKNFNFSNEFTVDDIPLADYESRYITEISSSGAYDIGPGSIVSYNEEPGDGDHTKKVLSRALKHFLAKSPLTITTNGKFFIDEGINKTIGNTIRIVFMANKTLDKAAEIDSKLSGDYIIYGTQHSFKKEKYDLKILCAKIANFDYDTEIYV